MHSEQPKSTPVSHSHTSSSFGLKKHMQDSWKLMTEKLLPMILLNLLSLVIIVILFVVGGVIAGIIFIGSPEFLQMLQSNEVPPVDKALSEFKNVLIQLGAIIGVVTLLVSYFTYAIATALIYVVGSVRKISFGEALGIGFQKSIPVWALGLFVGFLALGGYTLFLLPGFAITLMLMFVLYSYILGKTSFFGSLRRSVQMVSSHFALVLGRYLLILIGSMAVSFLLQTLYNVEELIFLAMTLSILWSWAVSFYAVAFFVELYRYLDKETPHDKPAHLAWIYITAGLGLLILGTLLYFGITKGVPFIKEQIAAEIAREIEEVPVEFSDYIDSACGITIPITNTYDDAGRRWIYEERWVSNASMRGFVPEKQLNANGSLLAMTSFKTNAQKNPEELEKGETYQYGYPGFVMFCTANTQSLTLEEFVAQAQETEDGTVKQGETGIYGEVAVHGVRLSGVNSDGNYYNEPLFLAVSEDGSNLIIMQLWNTEDEAITEELSNILDNLSYSEAKALKDPGIKTQNTKPAAPACQQLKIYEGEFASDKCYSAQDYKDLQYYLQAYNSAIFSYNAAISGMSITCDGSEFFKNECEEDQRNKSDAEAKISQYKGTIQSIMARGK